MQTDKPLILVLCTGNSCRSHMAEGILRAASQGVFDVASAGSKPAGYVHPLAIKALALHPLVPSVNTAREIFDGYRRRLPDLAEAFA